jgi:hypothetical protein
VRLRGATGTSSTSSHDDGYGADTVGANPIYGGDPVAQVYLDTVHPWGIATFDLDPGDRPGGQTSISVNFYHTPAATRPHRTRRPSCSTASP